mgnify:CR=1 FL=1
MAKKEYKASSAVTDAKKRLEEHGQKKPDKYVSEYDGALRDAMEKILNQEDFQYRLNGDALYRQYRNQAVKNGQRAMEDTMGQAAALTGGYGNSYARQLDALGDKIPALYRLAMEQYKLRAQGLQDRYRLLGDAENQAYRRYTDSLNAWQAEADRLMQQYTDTKEQDYSAWRDEIADWKWQQDFDENKRRYDQEWDDKHPRYSAPSVSYSYSSGSNGGKKTDTGKTDRKTTGALGVLGSVLGALSAASGKLYPKKK